MGIWNQAASRYARSNISLSTIFIFHEMFEIFQDIFSNYFMKVLDFIRK